MEEEAVTVISVNGQHADDFVKAQADYPNINDALVRVSRPSRPTQALANSHLSTTPKETSMANTVSMLQPL